MKLFKQNKPKKRVHAIALLSGAFVAPVVPSFLSYFKLPFQLPKPKPHVTKRAVSHSALDYQRTLVDDDFKEFETECAQHEAYRVGMLQQQFQAKIEENEIKPAYSGLVGATGARLPMVNRTAPIKRNRRIQSAPCFQRQDSEDFEDIHEFFVDSVKQKVVAQHRKKQDQEFENWDDDFSDGEEEIQLPVCFENGQSILKADIENLRKFDLHVQDAVDLENGLRETKESPIFSIHSNLMKHILILLQVAEFKEGQETIPREHWNALAEIMPSNEFKGMVKRGHIDFSNEFLKEFLDQTIPLKNRLVEYVSEMRKLVLQ